MDYDFNPEERPRRRAASGLLLVLAVLVGWLSLADGPARTMSTTTVSAAIFTYDAPTVARVGVHAFGAVDVSPAQLSVTQEGSATPSVQARGPSTTASVAVVATDTASGNAHGLGVSDPPSRVGGPWTEEDLARGAMGKPPKSLGSPELHHADQMPGAGIHEVDPVTHRLPGNHPNRFNQGLTDAMRTSDRQLHWWYRAQEMGGLDVLGPEAFYD